MLGKEKNKMTFLLAIHYNLLINVAPENIAVSTDHKRVKKIVTCFSVMQIDLCHGHTFFFSLSFLKFFKTQFEVFVDTHNIDS